MQGFETPGKQSNKQRTIKEIEAEVNSIKKSCGIPTQEGINSMFSQIDHQVKAVKDAANAYLQPRVQTEFGDRSEERAREQEGNELSINSEQSNATISGRSTQLNNQTPLKIEKPCPRGENDELLQSTAVGSADLDTLSGKRQRPFFAIEPKNLFQSETSKRVRFSDESINHELG